MRNNYGSVVRIFLCLLCFMMVCRWCWAYAGFDRLWEDANIEVKVENGVLKFPSYKKGPIKFYYDDKSVSFEGSVKDFKLHGPGIFYYKSGNVKARVEFSEGRFSGKLTAYSEEGRVIAEANVEHGQLKGVAKRYDPNDGHLVRQETYSKKDDTYFISTFDSKGRKLRDVSYKNKIPNGVARQYDPETGLLQVEVTFVNGKIDGMMVEYYENGTKKAETKFKDGKVVRVVAEYYESGELKDSAHPSERYYYKILDGSSYTERNGSIAGWDPKDYETASSRRKKDTVIGEFKYESLSSETIGEEIK